MKKKKQTKRKTKLKNITKIITKAYLAIQTLFRPSKAAFHPTNPSKEKISQLEEYSLLTRQLPPKKIKLLKNDILAYYLFDYTSHPPLRDNTTAQFTYRFPSQQPLYTFYENRKQANLSYLIINASKIKSNKPTLLEYEISVVFNKGELTKTSQKSYQTWIEVIDKYKTSKANFEHLEEGFTLRMRSNDSNVTFPMDSTDIFGNNLNISIKQIDSRGPPGSDNNVKVQISKRYSTINASFYRRLEDINVIHAQGFSLTADSNIQQRIDKPWEYQVTFISYDLYGNLKIIEALTFEDLEIASRQRINSYTHLLTVNSEKKYSYLILFLLKMGPKDHLPLTRIVYPDYKLVYYQLGKPLYSSSFAWLNSKVILVFKLEKEGPVFGSSAWEQKVQIFHVYLADQSFRKYAQFSLANLKDQLDEIYEPSKKFKNITCNKIETFAMHRGVLGCNLITKGSPQRLRVYISFRIEKKPDIMYLYEKEAFALIAEEITTDGLANDQNSQIEETCLLNFYHSSPARSNVKPLIKPFGLIFYQEGVGYYMKSQTSERIELLKEAELDSGLHLKESVCDQKSKTLILRFQKNLPGKRKTPGELEKKTWSKDMIIVVNLDSKFRATNRILTKIERDLPFWEGDKAFSFEATYVFSGNQLVIGETGQLSKYRRLYYRTTIELDYPKINLSTNSTVNFTADLKIYINQAQMQDKEPYGFPFTVKAQTPEKFSIKAKDAVPSLSNGIHNLEDFVEVRGPMNTLQQISSNIGRLRFRPRVGWGRSKAANRQYFYIVWVPLNYFFGLTQDTYYLYDFRYNSTSELSYTDNAIYLETTCCVPPRKTKFFVLNYNPSLQDSLSIQILRPKRSPQNRDKILLKKFPLIYIDSRMLFDIHLGSSKMFLTSVAEGVLALCVHRNHLIKIIIVDYSNTEQPVQTLAAEISAISIGSTIIFKKVEIISMMKIDPSLRTLAVIIGTKSHIHTEYVNYYQISEKSAKETTQVSISNFRSSLPMNGSLEYIKCEGATSEQLIIDENRILVNSACEVVISGYLMKTIIFQGEINKNVSKGIMQYVLGSPRFHFHHEYEIPRFYEIMSLVASLDYLAVHLVNTNDYHQEIMIYKRGRRHVWQSFYSSYETPTTYDIRNWGDGTTWIFINEIGVNMSVYLVSNMTLEVSAGYNSSPELEIVYSTFGSPRVVGRFNQTFSLSENLVKDSNLILVVYGAVGGFLGVVVLLCFCSCLWKCVYDCCVQRLARRKKRLVPVLVREGWPNKSKKWKRKWR